MIEFLLLAIGVAVATYYGGGVILEILGSLVERQSSKAPSSVGVDAAVGQSAQVIKAFFADEDGRIRGRVRFEGEDWRAVFVGDRSAPPADGDSVSVVDVDTGRLELNVK